MLVIKKWGKPWKNWELSHKLGGLGPLAPASNCACIWPQNSSDLNPVYYAISGALQYVVYHRQSFVSVDELKRTIVEAWRKLSQSFSDESVGDWDRRLGWLRSATAGEHIELMFKWDVKCWFYVPVLFVDVFCSVIWCKKRTNDYIRHLLRLLSFARWRQFIFQS